MAQPTDQRDQPFGVGVLGAAHRQAEPGGIPAGGVVGARAVVEARATLGAAVGTGTAWVRTTAIIAAVVEHLFRSRKARAVQADQGGGDGFGRTVGQQLGGQFQLLRRGRFVQQGVFEQPDLILGADLFGQRRAGPLDRQVGGGEQPLGGAALGVRDHHDRDALLARTTRATAAVQQAGGVGRQVGVNDQAEVGQIEAPGGDVGGDAGPRMTIPQRLQRVGAFLLREFTGQLDGGEAAFAQRAVQVTDPFAGGAEDQRAGALEIAQQVDHRVLDLVGRHADGAVLDVAVRLVPADGVDAHSVALIALGQRGDFLGDGG